jgi:hypothetical protein
MRYVGLIVIFGGMAMTAAVTQLGTLRLLATRGSVASGEVLRLQASPRRDVAVIRVRVGTREVDVSEPCVAFSCDVGSRVAVTFLPGNLTVRAAGDVRSQLRDAELFTFVVTPLFLGVGVAYSAWKLRRMRSGGPWYRYSRALLPYAPILASSGSVLSTVVTLVGGAKPARFELASAVFLILGSAYYLRALRRAPPAMNRQWLLPAALYGRRGPYGR